MSQRQFFKEGKWLTNFLLFGNRQIVYHHPISAQGEQASIKRMALNQSYPAQQYLASRLCQQTYHLTKQLRKSTQNIHSILISHLRNMMSYFVKVQTQGYHNILYLTLKYLAYLVSKEAIQQSIPLQDEVSLENWLADIHAIYFQTEHSNNILPENSSQEQLLSLLKKGDYQAMISKLRYLYCTTDKQDKSTLEKIDLLITLLLIRTNNKACYDPQRRGAQQQFSTMAQRLIQNYKEMFSKIFQNDKKQGTKRGSGDAYTIIGKVLMGEEGSHQKIAQKSWPLYIMNHLNFGNATFEKISLSSAAFNFRSRSNNNGRASTKQTQYLFKLLGEQSSHQIYQSLFQIVPAFYAHLIGYFLSFIQPNPIATVFVEDYTLDIIRNVLYHSSQISFQCLIYLCANFQQTSVSGDRLAEIFQPLLVQHLCVMDDSDTVQLNSLLLKVRLMADLNLQRYVYSQLNLLLNNLLQRGVLNRQVLLVYAFCSILFFNYYNYQELLTYYLEEIFISRTFTVSFLQQYRNLSNQIQDTRDKKLLKQLNRIQPLLDKFFRMEVVLKEEDLSQKIDHLIDLIQKTYRSVTVLQVALDLLAALTRAQSFPSFGSVETRQRRFVQELLQFLTHYPSERGQQEASLIAAIEQMIN